MIRNVAVWKETTPVHNQSGIKQGDVINPALFNAGLGDAMSAWKQHLGCHGASVGPCWNRSPINPCESNAGKKCQ